MGSLITNRKAFPGTSINLSTNLINVGLGTKLLVTAGILNSVIIGGWNRLLAGTSTVIQLGTKMNANLTNSANVSLGSSWHYLDTNQTNHEFEVRWAENQLKIMAGNPIADMLSQPSYHIRQIGIVLAVIVIFSFTLGISIMATLLPPFKRNNSKISLNSYGSYIVIAQTLSVICVLMLEFMLAKKMSKSSTEIPLVSNLSLAQNGISMCLFDNPDSIPKLVLAGNSQDGKTQVDHYIFSKPGNLESDRIGYSLFGILPGEASKINDAISANWRNPQHGIYPLANNSSSVISMQKYSFEYNLTNKYYTNTTIDMNYYSTLLTTEKTIMPLIEEIEQCSDDINKQGIESCISSIYTDLIDKKIIIQCSETDYENNKTVAGMIISDREQTCILRNDGNEINIMMHGGYGLKLTSDYASITSNSYKNGIFITNPDNDIETVSAISVLNNQKYVAGLSNQQITLGKVVFEADKVSAGEYLTFKIPSEKNNFIQQKSTDFYKKFQQNLIENLQLKKQVNTHISSILGTIDNKSYRAPAQSIRSTGYTEQDIEDDESSSDSPDLIIFH